MTSGRDEYLGRKHIDYEAESERRITHLELTGGAAKESLTVEDFFAAEAMKAVTQVLYGRFCNEDEDTFKPWEVAETAYDIAQAMLKMRNAK